jgi:hypothetical protein
MTDIYFGQVLTTESALSVTLKHRKREDWSQSVVIGIDQFETLVHETAAAKLAMAEARAVSTRPRMPKPLEEIYRFKTCRGCGVRFYDDSMWGNKRYHDPQCRIQYVRGGNPREKACKYCGARFTDTSRSNNRKYCTDNCRALYNAPVDGQPVQKKAKPKVKPTTQTKPKKRKALPKCKWCGGLNPKKGRYCSKECERMADEYRKHTGTE